MLATLILALTAAAPAPAAGPAPSPLVEQLGAYGFYQLESPSFDTLTPKQKRLAYWLSRAAIAIDPIIYDQLSAYGLKEKKLLGAMVRKPQWLPASSREALVRYAKLFFANKGNHNATTNAKLLPELSFESFEAAAFAARKAGARLPKGAKLGRLLDQLKRPLFDPSFEPSPTVKNPPKGEDIITASSNTFYGPGVTLASLKHFHDEYPLNSRVVQVRGRLVERVYRAGTPDGKVKPGLYAKELSSAIHALQKAATEASAAQRSVIDALIRFYQTGSARDWHAFNVRWVQNDATVDFVNGFIETYRDARSAKGGAEALVSIKDQSLNPLMQKIAANALYFERKAPWADIYKKLDVKPPVGKAVEALVEGGDFGVSTIGDNLPNEEDIHRQYGTKNFLIANASEAFNRVAGLRTTREFMPDDVASFEQYGAEADNLLTAMHEIIGHGSGKSRTTKEPRETLREYYSTLEEARADLVAYWDVTDPKLTELGVQHQPEVAHEMYAMLARSVFGVLKHYPTGDEAEEDHDRDRLLIWNFVAARGGVRLVERNGKHFAEVADYDKAHKAVGELLAELMRIKGEGDYDAIRSLVAQYGLRFAPKLRDEVVARYRALGLPTYSAGIYADLELSGDGKVTVAYPRDFLTQQLSYAHLNGTAGF